MEDGFLSKPSHLVLTALLDILTGFLTNIPLNFVAFFDDPATHVFEGVVLAVLAAVLVLAAGIFFGRRLEIRRLKRCGKSIEEEKRELTRLSDETRAEREAIRNVANRKAELEGEIDGLKGRVRDLAHECEARGEELAGLQGEIENAQGTLKQLQVKVAEATGSKKLGDVLLSTMRSFTVKD